MAAKLTKLTGTETKVLFERLAKGRMRIIAGSQCNLGNVHGTHPQFSPRAFQPHTTHVAGGALADTSREDAMEMGYRETGDSRQHFPIEWFADVLMDISHHILDTVRIILKNLGVAQHTWTIVYQNTCSLLQMYHFAIKLTMCRK